MTFCLREKKIARVIALVWDLKYSHSESENTSHPHNLGEIFHNSPASTALAAPCSETKTRCKKAGADGTSTVLAVPSRQQNLWFWGCKLSTGGTCLKGHDGLSMVIRMAGRELHLPSFPANICNMLDCFTLLIFCISNTRVKLDSEKGCQFSFIFSNEIPFKYHGSRINYIEKC